MTVRSSDLWRGAVAAVPSACCCCSARAHTAHGTGGSVSRAEQSWAALTQHQSPITDHWTRVETATNQSPIISYKSGGQARIFKQPTIFKHKKRRARSLSQHFTWLGLTWLDFSLRFKAAPLTLVLFSTYLSNIDKYWSEFLRARCLISRPISFKIFQLVIDINYKSESKIQRLIAICRYNCIITLPLFQHVVV